MSKKSILTVGIVGVMIVFTLVFAAQANKPKFNGETISKTFSSGAPCATATVPLSLADGADQAAVSETLFAALEPVPGMNTATLNTRSSSIEVGFCESRATEAAIRQALAPTGLVAEGPAPPAPPVE